MGWVEVGFDWFGLYWVGLDWDGLAWIELDRDGLDWIGLELIGMGWGGLGWALGLLRSDTYSLDTARDLLRIGGGSGRGKGG